MANRQAYLFLGKPISLPVILEMDGLNLIPFPDLIVDISDVFAQKIEIIKKSYPSQLGESLINFLEGLNIVRGARIHTKAGEGFSLVKLSSRPLILDNRQLEVLRDLLSSNSQN